MNKICKLLKDKKGMMFPLAITLTLAIMIIMCAVSEYIRLVIIASGVRDAMQQAIVSVINDNYDDVYHGVREGYAGGYMPNNSSWDESIDYSDVYGYMDSILGSGSFGGEHIKYSGSVIEYKFYDLDVNIENTTFAPDNPSTDEMYTADAKLKLEVPMSFVGNKLSPMKINLKLKAGYRAKF